VNKIDRITGVFAIFCVGETEKYQANKVKISFRKTIEQDTVIE
jgi:hypothetical protein